MFTSFPPALANPAMTQATAKNAAPGSNVKHVFTLFPKLPLELAVRIWKYAAQGVEPRFIVFRRKSGIVPGVLHACHLSRSIAMRGYQFLKYRKDHGGNAFTIPINYAQDVVFITQDSTLEAASRDFTGWFRPVKRLAISVGESVAHVYSSGGSPGFWWKFVDCCPDVEELVLVRSWTRDGEYVHVAELEWNLVRPFSDLVLQRHHRFEAREDKNSAAHNHDTHGVPHEEG